MMNTDLFGQPLPPVPKTEKPGKPKTNPMIIGHGPGPADLRCKDCQFQFFRELASKYSKCEKRGTSGSASTDHNSRYHTCGLFQPKPTGSIWFRYRCRHCNSLNDHWQAEQKHHHARMVGFGWQKSDEIIDGLAVWIRPTDYCRHCPPRRQETRNDERTNQPDTHRIRLDSGWRESALLLQPRQGPVRIPGFGQAQILA